MGNICQAETIKICYDNWAPMTIFPSESAPDRGFVIDILENIYTKKGYELEYYEVPLARGLNMVTEGICDMLPEFLFSKHSEQNFEYANEKTYSYTTAFVVRRDSQWQYSGIESIQGKRLATGPGWDYSSMSVDYQNHIDDPKNEDFVEVIAGENDVVERIFRMIIDNRIDLYADNEMVLQHTLNTLNLTNELKIVHPGLEKKLIERPIFSKNMPNKRRAKLIKVWDEGRVAIRGNMEQSILKKYNVEFKNLN
jgi:polar amino acid transport system substrate-binding protein